MNLPTLQQNLSNIIEDLLTDVADKNQLNPFDLSLTLSRIGEQAIGKVYTPDKICIHELKAAQMLEDIFHLQLQTVPTMLQNLVHQQIKGINIQDFILKALSNFSLMMRYNSNFELEFFKIDKEGTQPIDIDEFFATLAI
ncbi:hypothetical protein [Aureispira anguillae]|uniref:Uncharacterized protein n=1 Tax=Aureispira anguillae TaxID=2864201 RepID=A0A915YG67_9BACT|nr:hypothetical protein [Aureispira anguillae]BDS12378.1 hypothetical protein AsAng_0030990 [Aureispira anguillae]